MNSPPGGVEKVIQMLVFLPQSPPPIMKYMNIKIDNFEKKAAHQRPVRALVVNTIAKFGPGS